MQRRPTERVVELIGFHIGFASGVGAAMSPVLRAQCARWTRDLAVPSSL
jgi:hypothetical protein